MCPVTAIQNRLSMMFRDYEALFPVLEELNVGFVAFSPLANGLLSVRYQDTSQFEHSAADYRSTMPQFSQEGVAQNRDLLALVESTAREKNATPAQISLAWMLAKKPYIVPIPGSRKESRIRENLGAAEVSLTAEEVPSWTRRWSAWPCPQYLAGTVPNEKEAWQKYRTMKLAKRGFRGSLSLPHYRTKREPGAESPKQGPPAHRRSRFFS